MLDLQSYLMYGLFLAQRREVEERELAAARRAESQTVVARVLHAVGDGLVASGSMLKRRYEPVRVQTSKRAA